MVFMERQGGDDVVRLDAVERQHVDGRRAIDVLAERLAHDLGGDRAGARLEAHARERDHELAHVLGPRVGRELSDRAVANAERRLVRALARVPEVILDDGRDVVDPFPQRRDRQLQEREALEQRA